MSYVLLLRIEVRKNIDLCKHISSRICDMANMKFAHVNQMIDFMILSVDLHAL